MYDEMNFSNSCVIVGIVVLMYAYIIDDTVSFRKTIIASTAKIT